MVLVKHRPTKKGRAPRWSEGEKRIVLSHGRSGASDPTLVDEERRQRWDENGVGEVRPGGMSRPGEGVPAQVRRPSNDADPINRWSAEQTARFMELCKDTVTDWNHQDYWVSLRQDWLAEDYVPNPKAFLPPMQRGNDQSRDQRERKDTLQNMTHNKNDPLTCGQVDCLIEDLFLVLDDQAQRNKTVAP